MTGLFAVCLAMLIAILVHIRMSDMSQCLLRRVEIDLTSKVFCLRRQHRGLDAEGTMEFARREAQQNCNLRKKGLLHHQHHPETNNNHHTTIINNSIVVIDITIMTTSQHARAAANDPKARSSIKACGSGQ